MAKSKNIPQLKPKTVLIKSKTTFKDELIDRISMGEFLYSKPILDTIQLEIVTKEVLNWDDFNKELIKQAFNNPDSEYFKEYSKINNFSGLVDSMSGVNTKSLDYRFKNIKSNIESYIIWLKRLVAKLPLIDEKQSEELPAKINKQFNNNGFIVHGHNNEVKYELARFIENDLRRKTIILHEEANKGRTIIEKFENYSSVDFAVALWTSDDFGKAKSEIDLKERARQNVIFETGFFIGKLGRKNVIVLYEKGVEIPSDYSGVVFIPLFDNWKDQLRKEIDSIYSDLFN